MTFGHSRTGGLKFTGGLAHIQLLKRCVQWNSSPQQKRFAFSGSANFDIDHLEKTATAVTHGRIVCNQVLYHLKSRGVEYSLYPHCIAQHIALVGYSPFGQGNFPAPGGKQGKTLSSIAAKHGKTPRQVALNFLTRRAGSFTIPKASNPDHTRENADAVGWKLDDEDLKLIDSVFARKKTSRSI